MSSSAASKARVAVLRELRSSGDGYPRRCDFRQQSWVSHRSAAATAENRLAIGYDHRDERAKHTECLNRSFCLAARNLGRRYIGIECNLRPFRVIEQRTKGASAMQYFEDIEHDKVAVGRSYDLTESRSRPDAGIVVYQHCPKNQRPDFGPRDKGDVDVEKRGT